MFTVTFEQIPGASRIPIPLNGPTSLAEVCKLKKIDPSEWSFRLVSGQEIGVDYTITASTDTIVLIKQKVKGNK